MKSPDSDCPQQDIDGPRLAGSPPSPRSTRAQRTLWPLVSTILLAFGLWFVTFAVDWGSFWVKISISAATLAIVSIAIQRGVKAEMTFDGKAIIVGIASAAVLYGVFFMGKLISTQLFDFAEHQIDGIYGLGDGSNLWLIAILLFFVTGPSEELYWRGYLQRGLSQRLGSLGGYVVATALYTAVHLWTLNVMLVGAAAVAGAFWGLIYWRFKNLAPVIISHSIWSSVIFAAFRV